MSKEQKRGVGDIVVADLRAYNEKAKIRPVVILDVYETACRVSTITSVNYANYLPEDYVKLPHDKYTYLADKPNSHMNVSPSNFYTVKNEFIDTKIGNLEVEQLEEFISKLPFFTKMPRHAGKLEGITKITEGIKEVIETSKYAENYRNELSDTEPKKPLKIQGLENLSFENKQTKGNDIMNDKQTIPHDFDITKLYSEFYGNLVEKLRFHEINTFGDLIQFRKNPAYSNVINQKQFNMIYAVIKKYQEKELEIQTVQTSSSDTSIDNPTNEDEFYGITDEIRRSIKDGMAMHVQGYKKEMTADAFEFYLNLRALIVDLRENHKLKYKRVVEVLDIPLIRVQRVLRINEAEITIIEPKQTKEVKEEINEYEQGFNEELDTKKDTEQSTEPSIDIETRIQNAVIDIAIADVATLEATTPQIIVTQMPQNTAAMDIIKLESAREYAIEMAEIENDLVQNQQSMSASSIAILEQALEEKKKEFFDFSKQGFKREALISNSLSTLRNEYR